ncbi:hypothetical protein Tco_1340549 [Tanacetum coccineum]
MFIVYGGNLRKELRVTCYTDVGFKTDKDDRKILIGICLCSEWRSRRQKSAKQSTIAMSSTKAELIGASEATMEAVWMRKFIDGLGKVMPTNKEPMEMLCDNTSAIAIANEPGIMKGARHYQRKYHYIREVIEMGEIVLNKVHTDDNVADPFTKPMSLTKHYEHASGIGLRPVNSLM